MPVSVLVLHLLGSGEMGLGSLGLGCAPLRWEMVFQSPCEQVWISTSLRYSRKWNIPIEVGWWLSQKQFDKWEIDFGLKNAMVS